MDRAGSADRLARLTLTLAIFMLLLLISVPLLVDSAAFTDVLPYALYSLFLTSIGVMIGISLTWLNLNESIEGVERTPDHSLESTQRTGMESRQEPLLSSDEQRVVDFLRGNNGEAWQAELVRELDLSASKVSRLLNRLEVVDIVERVREGMGKRVILVRKEGWS